MKRKLDFQSKKWEKEIVELETVWKKKNDVLPSVSNLEYITERKKQIAHIDRNYRTFYLAAGGSYQGIANAHYIKNNNDKTCIDNLYLSGLAELIAELLKEGPIEKQKGFKNFDDLDIAVYKLIATDQILPSCIKEKDCVAVCISNGDFEKAKKLLEQVNEITEVVYGSQYKHIDYLKTIFIAILESDEESFNMALENRIRKYRKNMVGYSVFIDEVSVALIKLAKTRGINCTVDVIEIPKIFFDEDYRINKEQVKLPFYDEVLEVLQQRGILLQM